MTDFCNFGGSSTRRPIRAKFGMLEYTNCVRLRAEFHLDRVILSPLRGKKIPYFAIFSTMSFCGGSAQRYRDKVECECTTTNITQSNDTKFLYSNVLMAKWHSLT